MQVGALDTPVHDRNRSADPKPGQAAEAIGRALLRVACRILAAAVRGRPAIGVLCQRH